MQKANVSIITAVKNRNTNLIKTVPSWLKVDGVAEVVIVDWNSDNPVVDLFKDLKDDRLKIIRIENVATWRTCRAFNLAIEHATSEKIMRLDSDYLVEPGIVQNHPLEKGQFYTGYWGNARNMNEAFTNGFVYFFKDDFNKTGGYNESFQMYGYDDDDFYNRMEKLPLTKLHLNNDFIYHIPHDISLRSNEFELINSANTLDKTAHNDLTIRINDYISKNIVIWSKDQEKPKIDYKIVSSNYKIGRIISEPEFHFSDDQMIEANTFAKSLLLERDTKFPQQSFQEEFSSDEISAFYEIWNTNYSIWEKKEGFHLIISLYNETKLYRCFELLKCLTSNLKNEYISNITVFYDGHKNHLGKLLIHTFLFKHDIKCEYVNGKPSFHHLFDYASKQDQGKFIIANSDIIYDETLEKLIDKNLSDTLLTLSRKNYDEKSNTFKLITWENKTPQYFSADSWIFQTPFKFNIRGDIYLGTMHSEPFLANYLYRQKGLKIYNPCLDINSYHIQKGPSEMDRMNTVAVEERDQIYTQEYNRLCGSDPISGVVWNNSDTINSLKHTQYKASSQYLFVVPSKVLSYNELKQILKFSEQYDRNVWIYDQTKENSLKQHVSKLNNNINTVNNTEFKNHSIPFNSTSLNLNEFILKNEKDDIWLSSDKLIDYIKNEFVYLNIDELNSKPKISIITPAYNAGAYIEDAIKSVLAQDYDNFEHIIIDADSKDGTIDILKKYPHLNWVSEKDKGQSDAMNKGFAKSTGQIIGYLNADDYYLPNAFNNIIEEFINGADFVCGKLVMKESDGSEWINNPSNSQSRWLIHWAEQAFPYNPVSYFYRREVQEDVKGYVVDNHYSMDFEFLLEASKRFSIQRIQQELGVFRFVKDNKSSFIMEQEDFWSDKKFGYVSRFSKDYSITFDKSYQSKRKYYYNLFKNQNLKLKSVKSKYDLTNLPNYLITMGIQRSVILEYDSVNKNEDLKVSILTVLKRYDECYLDKFIEYYQSLGIQKIIILGTAEFNDTIKNTLEKYNGVIYFTILCNIHIYKKHLINHILNKFLNNTWILHVEPSEFLRLPLKQYLSSIQDLVKVLELNNFTAIASNQIEMIPDSSFNLANIKLESNLSELYPCTTLENTIPNNYNLHNFNGNTLSDYKIKKYLNDSITAITKVNRDITNIPLFYNSPDVEINDSEMITGCHLSDFNTYTLKYTLHKHIYLDQLEDDMKYYKVFDIDYNLEKNLKHAIKKTSKLKRIDIQSIGQELYNRNMLIPSIKLIDFCVEKLKLDLKENSKLYNQEELIQKINDLMLYRSKIDEFRFEYLVDNLNKSATSSSYKDPNLKEANLQIAKNELIQQEAKLNKVYDSYSWKVGNGLIKLIDKFLGWIPAVKNAKSSKH